MNTTARSPKGHCLVTAAEAATEFVKDDDVLDAMEAV